MRVLRERGRDQLCLDPDPALHRAEARLSVSQAVQWASRLHAAARLRLDHAAVGTASIELQSRKHLERSGGRWNFVATEILAQIY